MLFTKRSSTCSSFHLCTSTCSSFQIECYANVVCRRQPCTMHLHRRCITRCTIHLRCKGERSGRGAKVQRCTNAIAQLYTSTPFGLHPIPLRSPDTPKGTAGVKVLAKLPNVWSCASSMHVEVHIRQSFGERSGLAKLPYAPTVQR